MRLTAKHWRHVISAALMGVLVLMYIFDIFSYFEFKLQDAVLQDPGQPNPDIVVIGIDEDTLRELGRFQGWSRQVMADAINILNSDPDGGRPAVIAIDLLFSEPGDDMEADANLAEACRDGGNVVVPSHVVYGKDIYLNDVIAAYETPFPALAAAAAYGLANGTQDKDGVVRRALLRTEYEGERLYSFPVQIYKMYTGEDCEYAEEHELAYIAYSGLPEDHYQLSFVDLFDSDFDPAFFEDCIVMIGAYATGLMDAYLTPVAGETMMHGVEIHANVVQMLLDGNFKRDADGKLAGYIAFALLAFAAAYLTRARVTLFIYLALGGGHLWLCLWLYGRGYVYTLLYPLAALVLIYIFHAVYSYAMLSIEKKKMKGIFGKYVDPKLVDKLIESGEADSNEVGVLKQIAVLFVDVRGFTTMSEALKDEPGTVVKILNEYLELTSASVFNNGGSVDKFVGDATMALFNGFVHLEDYVYKAVCAAWDIVMGSDKVNASVKEKYGVDIGFGVGVNCGMAIVGNLGPSFRKDYTAIGDTVNTAARLESNAKRSQVLISKAVYEQVKDRGVTAASIGELALKGKTEALEVFEVTGIHKEIREAALI